MTIVLTKVRAHHYAKLRLVKDDEEPSISTLRPEGQTRVDMSNLALRQLDEREAMLGTRPEAQPARDAIATERASHLAAIETAQKEHTEHWITARQWIVSYASEDGKVQMSFEVTRAEMEAAPDIYTVDIT